MSAKIIPFPIEPAPPSLRERLAVRREYRRRCDEIAYAGMSRTFMEALKEGRGVSMENAVAIFVAAMRREIRRARISWI
jgi:hypothetical protein